MPNDILHQPHDKFFKSTFERREVVQEYLRAFLPDIILENIDNDGMELDPTSYVNEALGAHYSDLVWNVPYGNKKIKIALLFEHKTAPDVYIQLQLLQYMLEVWNKNIAKQASEKPKKKPKNRLKDTHLIPIIPIVIYQNKNNLGLCIWAYPNKTENDFRENQYFITPKTKLYDWLRIILCRKRRRRHQYWRAKRRSAGHQPRQSRRQNRRHIANHQNNQTPYTRV
jgi:hypothetical protein